MPRRLACVGPDEVAWLDYELPDPLPVGSVVVRNTHGVEKHGTMVSFVHGHANKRGRWNSDHQMFVPGEGMAWNYPVTLGNMQVGVVEAVDPDVTRFRVGDRLVYFGGFAPTAVIDEQAGWPLDADTSWKAATCLDPASFAFCALRDGNVRIGDAVAVFGLGAIGLMAVQLARIAGCSPIIAIDPAENRRQVALQTGADAVVNPIGSDAGAKLRELTDWRGPDVVIEYSGTMEAMQAALRGVAFGGTVVAGAFPGPYKAGLDLGAEAHMNRPTLIFSRVVSEPGRDHPRWDNQRVQTAIHRMILEHQIDAEAIVTPVLPFADNLPQQYESIVRSPEAGIKMGVEYGEWKCEM